MDIQQLISCLGVSNRPTTDSGLTLTGIFNDARKVQKDSVFIAIPGKLVDGHQFIPDAIIKGARVLVVQDPSRVPSDYKGTVIPVPDAREALDKIACYFYGNPSRTLFCVGVTGTNGKTSITYLVEALLNSVSKSTGVIGTVDHHLLEKVWPSGMTTPDPLNLQASLREFSDHGAKAVAVEVSSHALDQKRVDSVSFDAAIFSNLTRDHLDYHGSMETYFQAKQRLFTDLMKASGKKTFAIVNTADDYGLKLSVAEGTTKWTYGAMDADFSHEIKAMGFSSTRFQLRCPFGEEEFEFPMSGEHNVRNAVAAIAAALASGMTLQECKQALQDFKGVPGRLQTVQGSSDISVFVDYAHSPDALENVLRALRSVRANLKSEVKIWTVFGCGGDRDKGKRPMMAQMALRLSDFVCVTSDNPRTEDADAIISDILTGVQGSDRHRVQVEKDRRLAIEQTIQKAQAGDVILIAGKGHENYQTIGTFNHPFNDYEVAQEALKKRGQI